MAMILSWYKDNDTLINFIKDIVYFLGAFTLIRYLWNWNFIRKTEKIESNLKFRQRIEAALDDYVIEKTITASKISAFALSIGKIILGILKMMGTNTS
jgi:hypothetical protein